MKGFGKRRGIIEGVQIKDGTVLCTVEDMNVQQRTYPAILTNSSGSTVEIPPVGSKVLIEEVDGDYYVTNIITVPSQTGGDEQKLKEGAENGKGSMTFVFGPRDSASNPEKLSIEYRDGGYVMNIDIDGALSIKAGGTVTVDSDTVKLGGESGTKVVARKGDAVETNDPLTGSNSGTITEGATNTEAK